MCFLIHKHSFFVVHLQWFLFSLSVKLFTYSGRRLDSALRCLHWYITVASLCADGSCIHFVYGLHVL
jgi:hypothetical protein